MAEERFEVEYDPHATNEHDRYTVLFIDRDGNRHVIGRTDRRGADVTTIIRHFVYGKGSLGGTGGLLTSPVDPWPGREKSPLWAALLAKMKEDATP